MALMWAMRGSSLVLYPGVSTSDTILVKGRFCPSEPTLASDSEYIFGDPDDIDDGLNHMRDALLLWRVAARVCVKNRELSQNLEFRAQQAERELYVEFDRMRRTETNITGIVSANDV